MKIKADFTKALLAGLLSISSPFAFAKDITVGGKGFTEQLFLAEMTTQLLEKNGFSTDKRDGLGSTVLRAAQVNGEVDIYWEYTGTSLITYNKVKEKMSADAGYRKVKELDAEKGLVWLNPSRANNTYALAVRKGNSKTDSIRSLSDLAKAYNDSKELKMALNAEFPKRPDGLIGLEKVYNFKVGRANIVKMDSGLIYSALKNEETDIALVFATDGRIGAFDFRVLQDDKEFFPHYAITPVIRKETLDQHPKLGELLNAASALLTDEIMQDINGQIAVDKKSVENVAKAFVAEHF